MLRFAARRTLSGVGRLARNAYEYWHVFESKAKEGHTVAANDVVMLLETEKVCVELRGSDFGITRPVVLTKWLVDEGGGNIDQKARSVDFFQFEDLETVALAHLNEGAPRKALECLQTAQEEQNTLYSLIACVAYRQLGDIARANVELQKAKLNGNDLSCYVNYEEANLAILARDFVGAQRIWDTLRLHSRVPEVKWASSFGLATVAAALGSRDEVSLRQCKTAIDEMVACGNVDSVIYRRLVTLAHQMEDTSTAVNVENSNSPILTILPSVDAASRVARLFRKSRNVVAITGSGISVGSGLKTRQQLWQQQQWNRDDCVSVWGNHKDPSALWKLIRSFLEDAGPSMSPQPSEAHYALAALEECGVVQAVVTQNVDGLHQAAGSKNVIELHGSLLRVTCRQCSTVSTRSCADHLLQGDLNCPSCKSVLRPDVVLFGEVVPLSIFEQAKRAVNAAEVLLVVGTACDVAPARDLIAMFASLGKPVIEVALTPSLATKHLNTQFVQENADSFLKSVVSKV